MHYYNKEQKLLYSGDGGIRSVEGILTGTGETMISNYSGTEIYIFNSSGQHLRTVDAFTGQVLWSFSYVDPVGWINSITNKYGQSIGIEFTESSTIIVSPYGQRTEITYPGSLYANAVIYPSGATYRIESDFATGRMLSFTRPEGQKSIFTYDEKGYLLKDENSGGGFVELISNFDLTSRLHTISAKTATNLTTTYENRVSIDMTTDTVTLPSGAQSTQIINPKGGTSYTDNFGGVFSSDSKPDPRFGWNSPFNFHSSYSIPNSNIQIKSLTTKEVNTDPNNPLNLNFHITKTTLQDNPAKTFRETHQDNGIYFLSPEARTITKYLNNQGNISALLVANLSPTYFDYDSSGALLSFITQGERVTSINYNDVGLISEITNPLGQTKKFEYNTDNFPTKIISPDDSAIEMSYDRNGNLISLKPAGHGVHHFSYNIFNLIGNYLPPAILGLPVGSSPGEIQYQYNLDKKLQRMLKSDGSEIVFNYNSVTGLLDSFGTPEGDYLKNYNSNSELVSSIETPNHQKTSYSYVGKYIKSEIQTGPVSTKLQYSFNPDASIAQYTVQSNQDEQSFSINYDLDGLVTKVGELEFQLNDYGAIIRAKIRTIIETIQYNNYGEYIKSQFQIMNKPYSFSVVRDSLGRIIQTLESGIHGENQIDFTFDNAGRLIKAVLQGGEVHEYTYDENGNRIQKKISTNSQSGAVVAQYDEQDRLIQYGDTKYFYNFNGELIRKEVDPENGRNTMVGWIFNALQGNQRSVTTYAYNSFGALTSVRLPDNRLIYYVLDAQNRRLAKLINGQVVRQYIYISATQIGAELDQQGNIIASYVYGSKSNVPDYVKTKNHTYRLISNQVGTPLTLIDADNGKVIEDYDFDEFGLSRKRDRFFNRAFSVAMGVPLMIPFGFAGGLYDQDTELTHFGARDYDAETGGWLERDPILFKGGQENLYVYVNNDPVNKIDPSGLYGTDGCAYYDDTCSANGGRYECKVAPFLCPKFPSSTMPVVGNISSCMRQCLEEKHQSNMPNPNQCSGNNQIGPGQNASDHAACLAGCLQNPENPNNPAGPNLPDGTPRLF
jgi:RHS repeat-associated protein